MKPMRLESARDVVTALGGIEVVGELVGSRPKSVSDWQSRIGSFPPRTYVVMNAALAEQGLSAHPKLWRMIPPASARKRSRKPAKTPHFIGVSRRPRGAPYCADRTRAPRPSR